MNQISIQRLTRSNWNQATKISLEDRQVSYVPTVIEGIAYAYIKPWDEALDPYVIEFDGEIIGFFYLSYTPKSTDNYWIGGFQIDKTYQGKGYGKRALKAIINFIKEEHPECRVISLTVEKSNLIAQSLYRSMLFINEKKMNQDGELIFKLKIS